MGAEQGGAEAQVGGPEVLTAVSGGFGPVPGCPGARATRSDHFPSLTFREKKNIQSGLSFRISLGALFYSSPAHPNFYEYAHLGQLFMFFHR